MSVFQFIDLHTDNLIIVQCLNWNTRINSLVTDNISTYNRTMLELKFNFSLIFPMIVNSYNRTMLELKYHCGSRWRSGCAFLIIVQCLNWNFLRSKGLILSLFLIIVQCLNWNGMKQNGSGLYFQLIIVQCLNWNFL